MLSDILQNYNRLSSSGIESDDLTTSEDRLLKTIVLINGALKTISSSLTEDYYTDLKVDMKTLESVLKKDGLVDEINQTSVKED
jgi:tRNA A-37 threonylcarbamoyl transferase component Bud32